MFKKVAFTMYPVKDAARARQFYETTLGLRRGSVINARWRVGEDIPLRLNGELVACGAFEVVGNHLAVRLTDLV